MAIKKSVAVRNAELDALETVAGTSPKLRIYSGSPPSATSDAATGTMLCDITLPSDWAANASGGQKTKSGTWSGTGAAAGTAGYFRIWDSTVTTCHYQGSISGTGGGGDMELVNTSIAVDQPVEISTFTRTAAGA